VKPDAVRWFVCPKCQGDLQLDSSESREVMSGMLHCSSCGTVFPIVRGIPRFVGAESYADTFGRQWKRWARTQHDSLNGTTIFRDRLERYTGWTLASMAGKVVVDAGCGPGAFIDVLERTAEVVVGFDLSSAIESAYELHGARDNVHLAQGDIFRPPIRRMAADRLYTFGVVQHTPDPERAFRSLIPLVKLGGEIAVWVYRRRLIQPSTCLRVVTSRLNEPWATRFIEAYVPPAMKLSGFLRSVPLVGRTLRRLVPVADYRDSYPMLSAEQIREWALMDTHDGLITRYTFPQRWRDLERWMSGLEHLRRPSPHEMAAVARRPDVIGAAAAGAAARVA
jgi:uncharacterized protein YbaR (Trm112 family)/trans-aconitate methyltransferase